MPPKFELRPATGPIVAHGHAEASLERTEGIRPRAEAGGRADFGNGHVRRPQQVADLRHLLLRNRLQDAARLDLAEAEVQQTPRDTELSREAADA